jgi:protein TonB
VQLALAAPVADNEEVEQAFSAADLLAGQRYYTEVKNKIYRSVEYPTQALRAGREGNVSLDISLDARGRLLDTIVSQKSEFRAFDREAARAVKRSAPFPTPPESLLEDEQYQFKVVLRFKLNPE